MLLPGCSFYMDVVAVIIIESTSAQMKCSSVGIGRSIGRGTRIVVEIGNAMRKGKGEGRDADTRSSHTGACTLTTCSLCWMQFDRSRSYDERVGGNNNKLSDMINGALGDGTIDVMHIC